MAKINPNGRPHLTDRQKKKIIADYAETCNYSQTARLNKVSDTTVKKIVKNSDQTYLEKIERKKEENTQDMLEYLDSKKDDKKRVIELCFKALEDKLAKPDMFTSVRDIAMVYGVIVDKDLKYKELMNNRVKDDNLTKVEELLSKIQEEASIIDKTGGIDGNKQEAS